MTGGPDPTLPIREPTISEMLSDPVVQKVMARDGVTREEVEDLVRAARSQSGDWESWNGQGVQPPTL